MRSRYRRRRGGGGKFFGIFVCIVAAIVFIVMFATFFYKAGAEYSNKQVAGLEETVRDQAEKGITDRAKVDELQHMLQDRDTRITFLESDLQRIAPDDNTRKLMLLARRKLDAGVEIGRLQALIAASDRPMSCSEPTTRRLVVATRRNGNRGTFVRFGDAVTITANQEGNASAFYPDKPVNAKFSVIGGEESAVQGTLPLQQSVLAAGRLFQLTLTPGEKGSVEVSGTRCQPVDKTHGH